MRSVTKETPAAPYTEGIGPVGLPTVTPTPPWLSRCPDGTDTNNNNVDFQTSPNTPGARNTCPGDDAAPAVSRRSRQRRDDVRQREHLGHVHRAGQRDRPWFTITATRRDARGLLRRADDLHDRPGHRLRRWRRLHAHRHRGKGHGPGRDDPPDNLAVNFVVGFTAQDVCLDPFTPIYAIQGSGRRRRSPATSRPQGVVVGDFEGPTPAASRASTSRTRPATATPRPRTGSSSSPEREPASTPAMSSASRASPASGSTRPRSRARHRRQHRCRPPNIVDLRRRPSVGPTDVTLPFDELDVPRALRGHARPLPAGPRHLRVLQLRPVRRDRPRPAARRRGSPVHRHRARRARRAAPTPGRWPTACAGSPSTTPRRLRTRRSFATRTATPFSLTNLFRGGDTVANTDRRPRLRLQPVPDPPDGAGRLHGGQPATGGAGARRRHAPGRRDEHAQLLPHARLPTANDSGPGTHVRRQRRTSIAAAPTPTSRTSSPASATSCCRRWPASTPTSSASTRSRTRRASSRSLRPDQRDRRRSQRDPRRRAYASIDTGVIGTDAIRVGLIYRTDKVAPVGDFKILNSAVDPRFIDTRSRPVLAQTFEESRPARGSPSPSTTSSPRARPAPTSATPTPATARATATAPGRWPPRRSSTGSPPTRPAAAIPTS